MTPAVAAERYMRGSVAMGGEKSGRDFRSILRLLERTMASRHPAFPMAADEDGSGLVESDLPSRGAGGLPGLDPGSAAAEGGRVMVCITLISNGLQSR